MQKKFHRFLACVLLCLTVLSAFSAANAEVGHVYVINGEGVHLRKAPVGGVGNEGNILCSLAKGTKVLHLKSSKNWWYIRTAGGKVGYVYKSYLSTSDSYNKKISEEVTVKAKSSKSYVVAAKVLNVRAKPSTSSKILKTLTFGARVNVLSVTDGWGKVQNSSGKVGYVRMKYLTK